MVKNKNFQEKVVGDCIILINLKTNDIVNLNETASLVWKILNEYNNIVDIAKKIIEEYEISEEEAIIDVKEIINQFQSSGLIETEERLNLDYSLFTDNDEFYLYFPNQRIALNVNRVIYDGIKDKDIKKINEEDIKTLKNIGLLGSLNFSGAYKSFHTDMPTRLVLMPTNDCNLRCQYCYSSAGIKKKEYMSFEAAKSAIDYTFNNNLLKNGLKGYTLGFMGGGEPTLNWEVLTRSTEYVRELGKKHNVQTLIDLTTNAVLDDKQIDWVCSNVDFIRVSFDGPEYIQNVQRPSEELNSYQAVYNSLKKFDKNNKDYLIRCTLTTQSVEKMPEILDFFVNNFNLRNKGIIFNPVYVCGSCESNNICSIDQDTFINKFLECQKSINKTDTDVMSAYDKVRSLPIPKLPYCGFIKGNCFFTAEGYLSCCSEVDSFRDRRCPFFFFGKYDITKKELIINKDKLSQLYMFGHEKTDCKDCSIVSFCPGPCYVRGMDKDLIELLNDYSEEDVILPLSEEMIDKIKKNLGKNQESRIQCNLSRKISKREIINAIENYAEPMNGLFRVETLYQNENSNIKKAIKLTYTSTVINYYNIN